MAGHEHEMQKHGQMRKHHGEMLPAEIYACPIHPEARASESGTCPDWGMSLEKVSSTRGHGSEKALGRTILTVKRGDIKVMTMMTMGAESRSN